MLIGRVGSEPEIKVTTKDEKFGKVIFGYQQKIR